MANKLIHDDVVSSANSKLKHGDDYREKLIHDGEKFQDKIISDSEKSSALSKTEPDQSRNSEEAVTGAVDSENVEYNENFDKFLADYNKNRPSDGFWQNHFQNGAVSYGLGGVSVVLASSSRFLAKDARENDGIAIASSALDVGSRFTRSLASRASLLHQEHKEYKRYAWQLDQEEKAEKNKQEGEEEKEDSESDNFEEESDAQTPVRTDSEDDSDLLANAADEKSSGEIVDSDGKRRNYSESEKYAPRKKQKEKDIKQNEKIIAKVTKDKAAIEKAKSKEDKLKEFKKKQRKARRPDIRTSVLGGIGNLSGSAASFLRKGDDNAGTEMIADSLDVVSKGAKFLKRRSLRSQHKRRLLRAKKKQSKLIFKDAKKILKSTDSYTKQTLYRKFLKRRRMKQMIREKFGLRLRDRLKNALFGGLSFKRFLARAALKMVASLLSVFGLALIPMIVILLMIMVGGGMGMAAGFQSPPKVLKGANRVYDEKEAKLYDQLTMESIKQNYPGYDFYEIIKEGPIGHNAMALLSYLTTEKNRFKSVREVESEMNKLFDKMYKVKFDITTWTEISHKPSGEPVVNHYSKLKITLKVTAMNKVVRDFYKKDENKFKRYNELIKSQGGMGELFADKQVIKSMGGKLDKHGNIISFAGGKEYDASPFAVKQVLESVARNNVQANAGLCAAFFSNIYENAGITVERGNANELFSQYCHSNDRSKLKPGMTVGVFHADNGTPAGWEYGHVGIYIGNNTIVDNIGYRRVISVDDWIRENSPGKPWLVQWGYPPGMEKLTK